MMLEDFYWALGLALLLLALAFWGNRRARSAQRRAERVRRYIEDEDLGGNSYFMPLPQLDEAVEIERTVEIDSLLSGESSTVAAEARRELEAPTDVHGVAAYVPMPMPPLPGASAPASGAPAQSPRVQMAPLPSVGDAPRRQPPGIAAQVYPVRELVLAWYEARGYRPEPAAAILQPIELILRHREDRTRSYAFLAVKEPLAAGRSQALLAKAQSVGVRRLLVAVQAPSAPSPDERLASMGLRQYDEASIRRELDRIDIRVAAKIIAVARKRAIVALTRSLGGAR